MNAISTVYLSGIDDGVVRLGQRYRKVADEAIEKDSHVRARAWYKPAAFWSRKPPNVSIYVTTNIEPSRKRKKNITCETMKKVSGLESKLKYKYLPGKMNGNDIVQNKHSSELHTSRITHQLIGVQVKGPAHCELVDLDPNPPNLDKLRNEKQ